MRVRVCDPRRDVRDHLLDREVLGVAAPRGLAHRGASSGIAEQRDDGARRGEGHAALPQAATDRAIARLDRIRWAKGKTGTGAIRLAMQRTMQRHCAVFRTGPLMEEGARVEIEATAVVPDEPSIAPDT